MRDSFAMKSIKRGIVAVGCWALPLWLAAGLAVNAEGVTLVQQRDGNVKTYANVFMILRGQTLIVRSADGKGVLRIMSGACSFAGRIQRCLPYSLLLTQAGRTRTIALAYGSVYLNLMNEPGRMPFSSEALAPHTALVLLKTARGTYVMVKGTLDEVKS
jgi:hypothetical protein